MRKIAVLLLAIVISQWGSAANANLKCGDAPMEVSKGRLAVTWVGPVPKGARVVFAGTEIFDRVAQVAGPVIPKSFPREYLQDLQVVDLFNAQISWNLDELTLWQKRHGIGMKKRPLEIFKKYLDSGHRIFSTLIEHPRVMDPSSFKLCSIILQHGIIVYDDRQEDLYIRSYFHSKSANDPKSFANFVPQGGVKFSFPSKSIWFPLMLTEVIDEPAALVVLDILTAGSLDNTKFPDPFRGEAMGVIQTRVGVSEAKIYNVTRVTAKLRAGQRWNDFNVEPN